MVPYILNYGTSKREVDKFILSPGVALPWGENSPISIIHCIGGWVDTRISLDLLEKR
jgi:hypothetical protein